MLIKDYESYGRTAALSVKIPHFTYTLIITEIISHHTDYVADDYTFFVNGKHLFKASQISMGSKFLGKNFLLQIKCKLQTLKKRISDVWKLKLCLGLLIVLWAF